MKITRGWRLHTHREEREEHDDLSHGTLRAHRQDIVVDDADEIFALVEPVALDLTQGIVDVVLAAAQDALQGILLSCIQISSTQARRRSSEDARCVRW